MWDVLQNPAAYDLQVNKGTLAKLLGFVGLIESFTAVAAEKNASEVASVVVSESGVWGDIFRDNSVEGKARQENLQELVDGIKEFVDMRLEEGNEYNRLPDFLAEVSLMSDQDAGDEAGDNHITLMTIHSAKGSSSRLCSWWGSRRNFSPTNAHWCRHAKWRRNAGFSMWQLPAHRIIVFSHTPRRVTIMVRRSITNPAVS